MHSINIVMKENKIFISVKITSGERAKLRILAKSLHMFQSELIGVLISTSSFDRIHELVKEKYLMSSQHEKNTNPTSTPGVVND